MKEIDMIDPRLRRDDVLKELVHRLKSAIGGRVKHPRKMKAIRKNLKLATQKAAQAKRKKRQCQKDPVEIQKKFRPAAGWD